jgi:methionyl-tRNA formyltransferase
MRLVFLGTPEAAVPPLRALHDAGHEVALVVSAADKRRGRGSALTPSPVKAAALELGLPVTDRVDDVLSLTPAPDLGVVVAYGRIIKPHILQAVRMINLHFSLLPRWRGAAPVERAILAGDRTTGVCVMDVEEGLDTGGVHRLIRIGAWTTHNGRRLKLWRSTLEPNDRAVLVPAADGMVGLLEVQPEGKGRMPARDWANGARFDAGEPLGT